MWIPIDTRLADHPRVHQIATACRMPHDLVVGILARLWGLCADLETQRLPGDLASLSECYRLPKGFLEELVVVGWAKAGDGYVELSTRNGHASSMRRAHAQHAAHMRWNAPQNGHAGAYAREIDTEKERKRQRRRASPPPALEGAAEGEPTFSAAAALRAARGISRPFEAPLANPVEQARALMGAQP